LAFLRFAVFFAAFDFFAFAFFAIAALLAMLRWRCRNSAYANRKHCIPITTERQKKHGYSLRKCVWRLIKPFTSSSRTERARETRNAERCGEQLPRANNAIAETRMNQCFLRLATIARR